jgi:hypothetical protein
MIELTVNQPGATVRVNGKAVGLSPLETEVFVDPGEVVVSAELLGSSQPRAGFEWMLASSRAFAGSDERGAGDELFSPQLPTSLLARSSPRNTTPSQETRRGRGFSSPAAS